MLGQFGVGLVSFGVVGSHLFGLGYGSLGWLG